MGKLKNKKARTGFNRPSIELGNSSIREWRKGVKVKDLVEGDIIAGSGVVKIVMQTCGTDYYIQAGETNELFLEPNDTVMAFVRKDS